MPHAWYQCHLQLESPVVMCSHSMPHAKCFADHCTCFAVDVRACLQVTVATKLAQLAARKELPLPGQLPGVSAKQRVHTWIASQKGMYRNRRLLLIGLHMQLYTVYKDTSDSMMHLTFAIVVRSLTSSAGCTFDLL